MTPEEQRIIDNPATWEPLGKGAYNEVFKSKKNITINGYNARWVLKTQQGFTSLSAPARAVRKWNELNPNYPALLTKNGWIAPYLGKTPASDVQIAHKLIDIYRRTRNIIGDAGALGNNFLEYNGEAICVDVDHAFRRGSFCSDKFGAASSFSYDEFITECSKIGYIETAKVIKTLFYLENNIPSIDIHDKYLTANFIAKLHMFRYQKRTITINILNTLFAISNLDPTNDIKDKYITPAFIESLQAIPNYQQLITKDFLFNLINKRLLKAHQASNIIKNGDLDQVKRLIEYNITMLDTIDEDGLTALHIAAINGHTEIVRYLISKNIDVNRAVTTMAANAHSNMTALDLAIYYGNNATAKLLIAYNGKCSNSNYLIFSARNNLFKLVELLISCTPESIIATDRYNQTALLWAALKGHNDIVVYLISHGANMNTPTILPLNHIAQEGNYNSPLDWAIQGGHKDTILTLNQAGAITNNVHHTINTKPLSHLILNGELELVKILIEQNLDLLHQVNNGYAPLHYAAWTGNKDIVNYLFTKGADLNATTYLYANIHGVFYPDMTALELLLALQMHDETALLLIDLGAAIMFPEVEGEFHAIHLAAKHGRADIITQLIEIDPKLIDLKDNNHQTALCWASSHGHEHIVKLLTEIKNKQSTTPLTQLSLFQSVNAATSLSECIEPNRIGWIKQ